MDLSPHNVWYWVNWANQFVSRGQLPKVPPFLLRRTTRPFWFRTDIGDFLCADIYGPVLFGSSYEKQVTELVSRVSGGFFVNAGANIGRYAVLAARNGSKVLAVEANPEVYVCLRQTVSRNHLERQICRVNAAAWSEVGTLRFDVHRDLCLGHVEGESFVDTQFQRSEQIPSVTLDSLVNERPSLILLDIEGSEPHALAGARKIIRWKTPIIFEANDQDHLEACRRLLPNYRVMKLDDRNYYATPR